MTRVYTEARDACFEELFDIASCDKDVVLLTVDTGAFAFKRFRQELPDQFFNVGIAEQNAMSVAAGLALGGKRVYVFGISNFVTLRCFEQLKIDICCMDLPVTVIGMGTGYVYPKDGPTHHMTDILSLVRTLPGLTVWSPSDYAMIAAAVRSAYHAAGPTYLYVDKGPFDSIYAPDADFSEGLTVLRSGRDVTLVATGIMVPHAMRAAQRLAERGIDASVIDLYRIKPLNEQGLRDRLAASGRVVTMEENTIVGGLGGLVCEVVAEHGLHTQVKRIGIRDTYRCEIGDRESMRSLDGMDLDGVTETIGRWLSAAVTVPITIVSSQQQYASSEVTE
jgi:transketolase